MLNITRIFSLGCPPGTKSQKTNSQLKTKLLSANIISRENSCNTIYKDRFFFSVVLAVVYYFLDGSSEEYVDSH